MWHIRGVGVGLYSEWSAPAQTTSLPHRDHFAWDSDTLGFLGLVSMGISDSEPRGGWGGGPL